jgi:tRNA(Glu) U13 pseudouridine synthase TruD
VFQPRSLSETVAQDELAERTGPERRKITLRFDLPPGCYATVLIKRMTVS